MRILVLSHCFPTALEPYGGIFVLEQICALRRLGIEVVPIAPTPWPPPFLKFLPRVNKYSAILRHDTVLHFAVEHPHVLVLPHAWPFACSGLFSYLACRRLIARCIRQQRIDLIHAHTILPDGFAAILLGREFNLPVVCTVHGSDVNEYPQRSASTRHAIRWALRRVHRLTAVSRQLKSDVLQLAGERQVEVVPNGADADLFTASDKPTARRSLGLRQQDKVIVFVGRLTEVKAIPNLLAALQQIQHLPLHLYLVGDGELKAQLAGQAAELGVAGRCTFVGNRPHNEIPQWFSAADCFVLCSRMEGLPTVIPEAMMCGIPIVATRVGGIPDIIEDGETGLLVPPGDTAGLARAIVRVLTDEDLQGHLGRRAAEHAHLEFSWKANAEKTAAVYQDAISAFRTGTAGVLKLDHAWNGRE